MKKRKIWGIASVLVIVGLLMGSFGCAPAAPAETIVLKVSNSSGPTYPVTIELERAMEMIEERSGGRIEFDYYPGGSLYTLKPGSEAIMDGLIDIATFKGGYFVDKLGVAAEIANTPFNFTFEGFSAHSRDPGGFFDFQSEKYEQIGVKLLSYPTIMPLGLVSTVPVRKLEDLKGTLVRTLPGAPADGWALLGAEPVFMGSGEIYEALMRGTVEMSNSSLPFTYSSQFWEVAGYFIECKFNCAAVEIAMALDSYNNLPSDLQQIVMDAFKEAEEMLFEEVPADHLATQDLLRAEGMEIIFIDDTEWARWKAAVQPVYDAMAEKYGDEWEEIMKIREPMSK